MPCQSRKILYTSDLSYLHCIHDRENWNSQQCHASQGRYSTPLIFHISTAFMIERTETVNSAMPVKEDTLHLWSFAWWWAGMGQRDNIPPRFQRMAQQQQQQQQMPTGGKPPNQQMQTQPPMSMGGLGSGGGGGMTSMPPMAGWLSFFSLSLFFFSTWVHLV